METRPSWCTHATQKSAALGPRDPRSPTAGTAATGSHAVGPPVLAMAAAAALLAAIDARAPWRGPVMARSPMTHTARETRTAAHGAAAAAAAALGPLRYSRGSSPPLKLRERSDRQSSEGSDTTPAGVANRPEKAELGPMLSGERWSSSERRAQQSRAGQLRTVVQASSSEGSMDPNLVFRKRCCR